MYNSREKRREREKLKTGRWLRIGGHAESVDHSTQYATNRMVIDFQLEFHWNVLKYLFLERLEKSPPRKIPSMRLIYYFPRTCWLPSKRLLNTKTDLWGKSWVLTDDITERRWEDLENWRLDHQSSGLPRSLNRKPGRWQKPNIAQKLVLEN